MKNSIKLLVLLFGISSTLFSQNFQGKAIYKSVRNMEKMEGGDPAMEQRMRDMMKKQMEKEYELVFDQYSSSYKKVEELDASSPQQGGMMVMVFDDGEASVLYKNTKEKRYASTRDVFGKSFLVKDQLESTKWIHSKDTKQIGEYTCYKATFEREQRSMTIENTNGEESEPEETVEIITVTVWYTPDIPVAHGPAMHWGLPGLIMEVQDGNLTTICTEVVMNPKDKIIIQEPDTGKKLTESEYEEIMDDKMKEMRKMNEGGRKKGNSHSVEITIEG